jgi:3-hydroxyacyl-[acyl-carrier-protein] dehydratase
MTNEAAMEAKAGETLDTQQIMALLPHRYPFLLVDRIEQLIGDESCIGIKNVTINEPFFQGHFPSNPVMPGVLLLEGMAQTAGAACSRYLGQAGKQYTTYLMTIDRAKFRRPVVPGDRLEFHMAKTAQRRNMWWFRGEAKVNGQIVCEATVGAMISVAP